MIGKNIRVGKLFSDGKNAIVVAIDHGAEFGPIPGLIDLPETVKKLTAADAILINPGMIEHCCDIFSNRQSPLIMARLTWTTTFGYAAEYKEAHTTVILKPAEALAMGADLVIASCILKTGDGKVETKNVELLSQIVTEKNICGIPLIGEYYPLMAEKLTLTQLHELVYVACRVIAELGADIIKTFYTGEKFKEIVKSVPIPILVLGAERMETDLQVLELAYKAVNDGAKGIVFGRNIFQAKDPHLLITALKEVVKDGTEPLKTAKKYSLS